MILYDKIAAQLPAWRERVTNLIKDHGDVVVDQVTIRQVYGGMRGVKGLVTDISFVDPGEGIRFRGMTIPEVLAALPKPDGVDMPYVGGLYYLLMVGEIPTKEEAQAVEAEWAKRAVLPKHVFDTLRKMPVGTHPMTLFSQGVLAMQTESVFYQRYMEGIQREDYWEAALEDAMNMTARLPILAAFIYCLKHCNGIEPTYDSDLDYGANFAQMMGVEDQAGYADLSRLYFILHSDHESGNVSAHVTHAVGSTLSDMYYAFSGGMNGLVGPLHGRANQECLVWLLGVRDRFGGVPTREQLRQFAWETLEEGKVIPGYGHAVLRVPDPRFTAQMKFAQERFPDDQLVQLAQLVFEVVPEVLREQGKAKNPSPNVDAISGTLQYYYGVHEYDFYTVLFGIGRALGVSANYVWARALGQPIERPKSLTTAMLEDIAKKAK